MRMDRRRDFVHCHTPYAYFTHDSHRSDVRLPLVRVDVPSPTSPGPAPFVLRTDVSPTRLRTSTSGRVRCRSPRRARADAPPFGASVARDGQRLVDAARAASRRRARPHGMATNGLWGQSSSGDARVRSGDRSSPRRHAGVPDVHPHCAALPARTSDRSVERLGSHDRAGGAAAGAAPLARGHAPAGPHRPAGSDRLTRRGVAGHRPKMSGGPLSQRRTPSEAERANEDALRPRVGERRTPPCE
jgi:hypothetical protein